MPYIFSEKHASRAERFFSTQLRYVEGAKAGQPFVLESWQAKIVRDVFGWIREDGWRRYRVAYIEVPRKNGKSTFAAGIALYLLLCDGEKRPQVYSCAGDRSQASIVFQAAREMVTAGTSQLQSVADLRQYKIWGLKNGGWYEACSAEAYAGHGRSPHGIVFDEVHTQPNRQLWDSMLSGRGARDQPLVWAITTAGHDRSSICWELHQRAKEAIRNPDSDPTFYGCIYGAEPEDDWTSEEVWAKANPNLGVSVSLEFLREECHVAKDNPAEENKFRNLYLNQWTEQAVRWIPMAQWDACADESLSLDDFAGESCYAGLDLASTRDLNALTLMFQRDDLMYAFPIFWMPEEPADIRSKQDRAQAKRWADMGLIRQFIGMNVTQYDVIARDIMELSEKFYIEKLAYDPWGPARALAQMLVGMGMYEQSIVEFRQVIGNFAAPSKDFERRIAAGTMRHSGCPVMRWMVSNVAAERDKNDNIRPSKSKSADKIDGVVSTIMAIGLLLQVENASVYESNGSLSL